MISSGSRYVSATDRCGGFRMRLQAEEQKLALRYEIALER
jgi:hypothetical protein